MFRLSSFSSSPTKDTKHDLTHGKALKSCGDGGRGQTGGRGGGGVGEGGSGGGGGHHDEGVDEDKEQLDGREEDHLGER